jgi:hypothetical protein
VKAAQCGYLILVAALSLCDARHIAAQSGEPARKPWTRAPGAHPTNLTAEATLQRVADLLEAKNMAEVVKSFEPNNRNTHAFLGGGLDDQGRSILITLFRSATLVKSGWWQESHGGVLDEYRLFKGAVRDPKGAEVYVAIRMIWINECSGTAGIHDPGEWIIFDWSEEFSETSYKESSFRGELPKDYRCKPSCPR